MNKKILFLVQNVLLFFFITQANAADPDIVSKLVGSYSNDRGSLEISAKSKNEIYFNLETVGSNFHTCHVEGIALQKNGYFEFNKNNTVKEESCRIKIWYIANEIDFEDVGYKCKNYYCGARASIQGVSFSY